MEEVPWDFNPKSFLYDMADGYESLTGQYFDLEYCPTLVQIEEMYSRTDLFSIELPLTVMEMFKQEVKV